MFFGRSDLSQVSLRIVPWSGSALRRAYSTTAADSFQIR